MRLPGRRAMLMAPLLFAAVAACARDRSPSTDSSRIATSSGVATGTTAAGKPACAGTGHWTPCGVLKRLEAAGVAPQAAKELPDLPELGASPMGFQVGRSALAVYLFADSTARATAARRLDTLHFISAAKELTMRGETTAIQNDNLLALLFSRSEQQRERVSDALTAGPPQPEQP